MTLQSFAELSKKEAIQFGEWLMTQGLIPTVPQEHFDQNKKIWDTKDGDWLNMEELYDNWRLITADIKD